MSSTQGGTRRIIFQSVPTGQPVAPKTISKYHGRCLMRGPLAGAFFLVVLQISACAAHPAAGSFAAAARKPPTAAPTNAVTSAASKTKRPIVTGQAKAGEHTSWFKDIQPTRSLAKVQ